MAEPVYQASTLALLRHLQKHGPMTVHQVEQLKSHCTTAAASRVANLLKRGSVARVGRSMPARYEITGKGREALKTMGKKGLAPRNFGGAAPAVAARPAEADAPVPAWRASDECYTAPELRPFDGRPGAMDAFALPSRMGKVLIFRDGRQASPPSASERIKGEKP
ncbi:MAG: replication-relaxation family protein [Curvibacter sp.]|nr:replication-relaxation family protein [Curvibacter sp.]